MVEISYYSPDRRTKSLLDQNMEPKSRRKYSSTRLATRSWRHSNYYNNGQSGEGGDVKYFCASFAVISRRCLTGIVKIVLT